MRSFDRDAARIMCLYWSAWFFGVTFMLYKAWLPCPWYIISTACGIGAVVAGVFWLRSKKD